MSGVVEIPLTKGFVALVDEADAALLSGTPWRVAPGGSTNYAVRGSTPRGTRMLMHRLILNAQPGQFVDHVNGDGLDNRRCNIRLCTQAENARNQRPKAPTESSPFKGVTRVKPGRSGPDRPWGATIRAAGRQFWLGHYATAKEAAIAYDRAAMEHHGAFAHLNFPDEWILPVGHPLASLSSRVADHHAAGARP